MPALKWNLCTSFAAAGAAIAYPVLYAFFGFNWQLVPAAVTGLIATYLASTALGSVALRTQLGRYPLAGIIVSVGIAWCTLFAGALAIALTTFVVAVIDGILQAPSGQPGFNVLAEIAPGHARELIKTPLVAGMWFGLTPAAVLGIAYGFALRKRFDSSHAESPSTRRWVRRAAGVTLLFPLLLVVALTGKPFGVSGSEPWYAKVPLAIRACSETAEGFGVLASCRGSPCDRGACDWEVEQDAFTLNVRPPAGSAWRWAGGGIGTTQRPDVIRHNIYWVQHEPDGSLNEGSARRYASYELVFDGDLVRVGESVFRFEPGMRLDIRFSDDWSVVASDANGEAIGQ